MNARRWQAKQSAAPPRQPRTTPEIAVTDRSFAGRLQPWCLAAAAALLAARPLWPSDSATLGGAGLPAALAWLLLLAGWLMTGVRDRRLEVRWRKLDIAVVLLVAWITASGAWAVEHAAPRPAINVVWEWCALAAAFWLIRQWVRTPGEARALVVVMITLGVVESVYALEQYFISLPADRAAYAADPDAMLRSNGLWFEPGSRERYLFEQRLASSEPFGTFELANSLGGFLAAWLVVACAVVATGIAQRAQSLRGILLAAAVSLPPVAAALTLTKSRSAILAFVVGLAAIAGLALGTAAIRATRTRYLVALGIPTLVLTSAAFGWLAGAFDWEVLSEAPKSLGYRWQYWQGSFPIIRQHPWLGCGPGNFRDAYPVYKLAEASEEIADPHNFLLEVATSAGLPALAALSIVLGAVTAVVLRYGHRALPDEVKQSGRTPAAILAGAAGGFLLAFALPWLAGPMIEVAVSAEQTLVGLAVGAVVAALWWPWIRRGAISPWVPLVGVIALLTNFLAAGGIGFPATAGTLWLLLGLALALADRDRPSHAVGRKLLVPASLGTCVLAVACYATAYRPVATAARALAPGVPYNGPADVEQRLLAAAAADPLDAQVWSQLASFRYSLWLHQRDEAGWLAFEQAAGSMLDLRPQHSAAWVYVGDCYFEAAQLSGDAKRQSEAIKAYRRAIELYPRQALRHAKLAVALARAGDAASARHEAAEALRLDALTPHRDQKLPDDLRQAVRQITSSESGAAAARFRWTDCLT